MVLEKGLEKRPRVWGGERRFLSGGIDARTRTHAVTVALAFSPWVSAELLAIRFSILWASFVKTTKQILSLEDFQLYNLKGWVGLHSGNTLWREALPKKRVSLQVRNLTKFCTVACNLTIEKSFTEANKYKHFWITVVFSRGNRFSRWVTWISHSSRVGLPQLFLVLILHVGWISGTNCNLGDVNSPYTFEKSPLLLCDPLCCVFWAGMRKDQFLLLLSP